MIISVELNTVGFVEFGKQFKYLAYIGEKITTETRMGFGESPLEAIADLNNIMDLAAMEEQNASG